VAVTKTEPSLLYGKMRVIGIYSENHKGHSALCGWMRSSLMLQQVVHIITTDTSRVEKRVPEIWPISTNYLPTTLTTTRGKVMNFVLYFLINSKYNVSNNCTFSENVLKATVLWQWTHWMFQISSVKLKTAATILTLTLYRMEPSITNQAITC